MRSYMILAVLALAASAISPVLSAPIRYEDLLMDWTFLTSGIPLGFLLLIPLPFTNGV